MPVTAHIHSNSAKVGSCPHGLPAGACPICSGKSGGNSTTRRNIPRHAGEMTYNECVAMGAMLRALKNARLQAKNAEQNRLLNMAAFNKNIVAAQQKLKTLTLFFTKNTPAIISKPINFILNKIVGKSLNFAKNIPNIINNFGQKLADISDKLTALFGEKKAAISKHINETWQKVKRKLKSIFLIFGAEETENEEKKIEEAKRIFDLKTLIKKIIKHKEKDNEG